MARFVAGVVFGVVVGVVGGAALGLHATDDDEVALAASEAGVDQTELRGAMNSTGLDARTYLKGVGELPGVATPSSGTSRPGSATPAAASRVACIEARESRGNPNARNPRSGAAGLGQFLPSTWATTPQGRAGLSVYDPAANRAAIAWMLASGRGREFVAVSALGC